MGRSAPPGRLLGLGLTLLASAFAGCLGTAPAGPAEAPPALAPPAGEGPRSFPWGLEGCAYVVAMTFVPGDRLEPFLPPGFALRRTPGAAAALGLDGDVLFGVDAFDCASGAGLAGPVEGLRYGMLWAAADPPPEVLAAIDADEVYVKWDILVPDAPRREALLAAGIPARGGDAAVMTTAGPAGPVALRADLRLDGVGAFAVEGAITGVFDPWDGRFAKVSAAGDAALAAWQGRAVSDGPRPSGPGLIHVDPSSWVAEVAGPGPLRATFHTGTFHYREATVDVVPLANPPAPAALPGGAGAGPAVPAPAATGTSGLPGPLPPEPFRPPRA